MIRIPKDATIIGELRCNGATRVDARVEGEGNINGVLLISQSCVWVGKITADKIIVEGTVEGQIIARQKLQIAPKGKVSGIISAPEMHLAPGAILNCDVAVSKWKIPVELLKPRTERRVESFPIDELAERRKAIQKTG